MKNQKLTTEEDGLYCSLTRKKYEDFKGTTPIKFPNHWEIQFIPPTMGAMVRFLINGMSVYYDFDGSLGLMDEPYYEVYGGPEDVPRFYDTPEGVKEFIEYINNAIERGYASVVCEECGHESFRPIGYK